MKTVQGEPTRVARYLNEPIDFSGEIAPRGEAIAEMQKTVASRRHVDFWLFDSDQANDRRERLKQAAITAALAAVTAAAAIATH